MRYLEIIMLVTILAVSAAGLIYFNKYLFNSYLESDFAGLQAESLNFYLNTIQRQHEQKETTLLFVGDIMLSREVGEQIKKRGDPRYPFLKTAEILNSADLTVGNLEGPISNRGENQGSPYSFRADPKIIEGLKFAGFDILSLANNHILDWGRKALEDTILNLNESGIETVGAGKNYTEANRPLIKEVNGIKFTFLSYTNLNPGSEATDSAAGISNFDLEEAAAKIGLFKKLKIAGFIVVLFHWGDEYQIHSNSNQREMAHQLIDAGADLIIGHHPHVIQEIENYHGKWIAYSLGNFVFDQGFSEETMKGLMLKVMVRDKKIASITPLAIKINGSFQPEPEGL